MSDSIAQSMYSLFWPRRVHGICADNHCTCRNIQVCLGLVPCFPLSLFHRVLLQRGHCTGSCSVRNIHGLFGSLPCPHRKQMRVASTIVIVLILLYASGLILCLIAATRFMGVWFSFSPRCFPALYVFPSPI